MVGDVVAEGTVGDFVEGMVGFVEGRVGFVGDKVDFEEGMEGFVEGRVGFVEDRVDFVEGTVGSVEDMVEGMEEDMVEGMEVGGLVAGMDNKICLRIGFPHTHHEVRSYMLGTSEGTPML
jgi:hypothetical protein